MDCCRGENKPHPNPSPNGEGRKNIILKALPIYGGGFGWGQNANTYSERVRVKYYLNNY